MIALDSLTGYPLPPQAASLLVLPAINQPPLKTGGNGPSSTTRRLGSPQRGRDMGNALGPAHGLTLWPGRRAGLGSVLQQEPHQRPLCTPCLSPTPTGFSST